MRPPRTWMAVPPGRCAAIGSTPSGVGATVAPRRPRLVAPARLKAQGTRHKGGRRSTRGGDEHLRGQLDQRVRARPENLQQRQELLGLPLGTMNRGGEQGSVLRRGVATVRAECSSTVLAYHLRRVSTCVAMPQRLAGLG